MNGSAFSYVPFLQAVSDCTGGNTKVQRKEYVTQGELPVIDQGQEFIAGFTEKINQYQGGLPLVLFGDHTRIFKYVDFPFALGADGVKALQPQSGFDARFLYYYFRFVELPNAGYSRHFKFLKEIQVPKPTLPEQRRIVDLLSRAEGIVRLRREAEQKAAELIPALFLDMFGDPATNPKGWAAHRLGDLALKMSDGPFGSNLKTSHYTDTGIRVIRLQNIGIGAINDKDRAFVSREHFVSLPRHCCLPGDVLIATLGDPNLRAMVLPPSIPAALNKADCVQFRCKNEIVTAEFICWLMNAPSVLDMAASMVQGITRTRISMGRLRELHVPVPPIELQREFVEWADQIRSIQSQQSAATAKAQAAFDALLARCFTQSATA